MSKAKGSYLCSPMYYIVYGLLYAVSLLPLRILYLFSDFTSFLLYYVFGYRKKVVMDNLLQAFPEKTDLERKKIAKQFYLNFTDNFIEVIKLVSASSSFVINILPAIIHFLINYLMKEKNASFCWLIILTGNLAAWL